MACRRRHVALEPWNPVISMKSCSNPASSHHQIRPGCSNGGWDRSGLVVARVPGTMAKHRIDHQGRISPTIHGSMGNKRWNAKSGCPVSAQVDAMQAAILQHDEINGTTQHQQLVGLVAVTKYLTPCHAINFSNQHFVTGLGTGEQGVACPGTMKRKLFNSTTQGHRHSNQ